MKQSREQRLEEALLEYVEHYGLTERARQLFAEGKEFEPNKETQNKFELSKPGRQTS